MSRTIFKPAKLKRIAALITLISISLLVGCGKSEPPPANNQPSGPSVGPPPPPPSICVPVGQPIGFIASNAYFYQPGQYAGAVAAGQIPPNNPSYLSVPQQFAGQSFGQVSTQPAQNSYQNPYQNPYPGASYMGRNMKGDMIQLSISQPQVAQPPGNPYPYYYPTPSSSSTANITGTVFTTVNPFQFQPGPFPVPGQQPQQQAQICVSGVGFALNIRNGTQLYLGNVYLYTNNSPHGMVLEF